MTKKQLGCIALLTALFLSGCGAQWTVSDQRFFKYQNKDIRIAGAVELADEGGPLANDRSTEIEARLYTDEYRTLIQKGRLEIGNAVSSEGITHQREIFKMPFKEVRLGGTSNSYPRICAEIRMDDSNISEWTRVGCVHADDTPSESPTGEIGRPHELGFHVMPELD
jgi:hypothetical protein